MTHPTTDPTIEALLGEVESLLSDEEATIMDMDDLARRLAAALREREAQLAEARKEVEALRPKPKVIDCVQSHDWPESVAKGIQWPPPIILCQRCGVDLDTWINKLLENAR